MGNLQSYQTDDVTSQRHSESPLKEILLQSFNQLPLNDNNKNNLNSNGTHSGSIECEEAVEAVEAIDASEENAIENSSSEENPRTISSSSVISDESFTKLSLSHLNDAAISTPNMTDVVDGKTSSFTILNENSKDDDRSKSELHLPDALKSSEFKPIENSSRIDMPLNNEKKFLSASVQNIKREERGDSGDYLRPTKSVDAVDKLTKATPENNQSNIPIKSTTFTIAPNRKSILHKPQSEMHSENNDRSTLGASLANLWRKVTSSSSECDRDVKSLQCLVYNESSIDASNTLGCSPVLQNQKPKVDEVNLPNRNDESTKVKIPEVVISSEPNYCDKPEAPPLPGSVESLEETASSPLLKMNDESISSQLEGPCTVEEAPASRAVDVNYANNSTPNWLQRRVRRLRSVQARRIMRENPGPTAVAMCAGVFALIILPLYFLVMMIYKLSR